MRALSKVAPEWWDYTTLDEKILDEAVRLSSEDLCQLSRTGFTVKIYDTLASFYTAEALEYVQVWQQASASAPAGRSPVYPLRRSPSVRRRPERRIKYRSGTREPTTIPSGRD